MSPYVRAQQTLAQFQVHSPNVPIKVQHNITPSDDARTAFAELATIEAECMVVVCHMSIIAYLASLLTGDNPESYALAEARVFDMEFIMTGMAREIDRFIPQQP